MMAMEPPLRVVAGRYGVHEFIARGEASTVWTAHAQGVAEPLAIRFLDRNYASNEHACARFFHGARIMGGLAGAGTPRVLDVGTDSGLPYIVMLRADGETLRARLERVRRLPFPEVVAMVQGVARALSALHGMGLVHRDLKPDHVLLAAAANGAPEGALLLGFGLAAPPTAGPEPGAAVSGTPYFTAPERIRTERGVDHRADLWGLGAIAYLAATGQVPYDAPSLGQLFEAILTVPLPIPSRAAPDLPPAFDAWFARACARDREARFRTAAELAEMIDMRPAQPTIGLPHPPPPMTPSDPPPATEPATELGYGRTPSSDPPPPSLEVTKVKAPVWNSPSVEVTAVKPPPDRLEVTNTGVTRPGGAPEVTVVRPPPHTSSLEVTAVAPYNKDAARAQAHVAAIMNAPSPRPAPEGDAPPVTRALAATCPGCGDAIEVPPMVFCPNCGRRIGTSPPQAPTPPPPQAAPAPPPAPPPPAPPSAPVVQAAPPSPPVAPEPKPAARAPAQQRSGAPPVSPDNPSAWLFRARLGTYDRGALRAAAFTIDGSAAVAAGPGRLCRTRGFMWDDLPLEGVSLDPARVRAIRAFSPDSFLLLGAGGLVAQVALDGTCAFWVLEPHAGAPIASAELTFYDALPEGDGAVLVGERPGATGTVGVLARAKGGTVRIVVPSTPAARLKSIARGPGGALYAVGAGRIVVFERDAISSIAEIAPGELHGVAVVDDGALVVGSGAYAFSVNRALRAQLEEVQTTADLVALAASDGIGWAGSNRGARILRRSPNGVWTRMTGNLGSEAGVIALTVIEGQLRAILDDGTFITGVLGT